MSQVVKAAVWGPAGHWKVNVVRQRDKLPPEIWVPDPIDTWHDRTRLEPPVLTYRAYRLIATTDPVTYGHNDERRPFVVTWTGASKVRFD